jgi:hypothetical protein
LEELEEKCITLMVKKASTGGKKVEVVSGNTKVVLQKDEAAKSRRLRVKHGDDEADVPPICEVDPPYCDDPHRTITTTVSVGHNIRTHQIQKLMILLFSTKTDSRVEKEVVFHP